MSSIRISHYCNSAISHTIYTTAHINYCCNSVTYPSVLMNPRTPVSDSPINDTLSPIFRNEEGRRQNPPSPSMSMSSCIEMALRIEALLDTPPGFFFDDILLSLMVTQNLCQILRNFHKDFLQLLAVYFL